jgi:hypothetical protein
LAVTALSVGDFNHDGKPDLVAVGLTNAGGGEGAVWLNDGSGGFAFGSYQTFWAPRSFDPSGPDPQTAVIAVGDFNGDGYADLAVVGFNEVAVYLWIPGTTKK